MEIEIFEVHKHRRSGIKNSLDLFDNSILQQVVEFLKYYDINVFD